MTYTAVGSPDTSLSQQEIQNHVEAALARIDHGGGSATTGPARGAAEAGGRTTPSGKRRRVLAIPPDMSRFHSGAGWITQVVHRYYGDRLAGVLPAIGTHFPMTVEELSAMFGDVPQELFIEHDWQNDLETLGTVPASYVRQVSDGMVDYEWPAQVNRRLVHGGYDLILSIGQVVPHEVIGMANYNKNVFVGTGGRESIHKSHYLGAVYGMERIMGRADTPVRRVLNYASDHFAGSLPIVYVLTVVGTASDGSLAVRGLFIGDDVDVYNRAAELAARVNITTMQEDVERVVVYLDPREYKSTWIGNKAIYRTRMTVADGGELIVIAPGVHTFGENKEIDRLIRAYGYVGSDAVTSHVESGGELAGNLAAAAHLIHGSSEDRFSITYCPGGLSREEIESVNFAYGDVESAVATYRPEGKTTGFYTTDDGTPYFFVANPGIGLWGTAARFGRDA